MGRQGVDGMTKPTPIGDNSAAPELLHSYSERVNRLMDEKEQIAEDISEIYKEAKGNGFDVRALRAAIKRQRADADALREHEELVALYSEKLGVLSDLPLGVAALERVR